MYRLDEALTAAIDAGDTVIAPNRQRAAALRFAHAWRQRGAGHSVWATPDVLTWEAWLARELSRLRTAVDAGPALLSPSQAHAQWREVLGDLEEEGADWTDLAAQATAIASAAITLREWLPDHRDAGPTDETRLLQRALHDFDALSESRGVLLPALATIAQLKSLPPARLLFVGVDRLTPRQDAVARDFSERGGTVRRAGLPPPSESCTVEVVASVDSAAEAFAAGRWCQARLDADPGERLLVVCADPRADVLRVRERMLAALPDNCRDRIATEGGEPLLHQPFVAVALTWLSLAADEVDLAALSTVLLSPLHARGSTDDCGRLDAWLRDTAPRRCPSTLLVRHLDSAAGPLREVARAWSQALTELRLSLDDHRRGPLDWAQRIVGALNAIGYPGRRAADSGEVQVRRRWEAAVEEFAGLAAFVADESAEGAIARFRELLGRSRHQAATGDAPVTVTAWTGDPVVGYDGIWVLGLAESQWPEPPRPDPFLPLDAQRRANVPAASTRLRLEGARRQLESWRVRAGRALVLGHAEVDGDVDLAPAVLLRGLPSRRGTDRPTPRLPHGQSVSAAIERSLPGVAARGQLLRGGVAAAGLQRECPFRSQASIRLAARPLETPRVGIDPSLRGELVHAALDRLWRAIGSSDALRARPLESWSPEIESALEAAFARPDFGGRVPPSAQELARERVRCRELLRRALELDLSRKAAFAIDFAERDTEWTVAGVRFRLRVDRVDALDDGGRVVIDYKTGQVPALKLNDPEPRPVQLLAYLDALGGDVAALALMRLDPADVRFRAVEDGRAGLPQKERRSKLPLPSWPDRLAGWRTDVHALVSRHLAGDAAVSPLRQACDHCALPALCRIDSQRLRESLDGEPTEVADE